MLLSMLSTALPPSYPFGPGDGFSNLLKIFFLTVFMCLHEFMYAMRSEESRRLLETEPGPLKEQ